MNFKLRLLLFIKILVFLACLIFPFSVFTIDTQPIATYAQAEVTFESEEPCCSDATFKEIQNMGGKILIIDKITNKITALIPNGKEQAFKTSMKKLKKVQKIETYDSAQSEKSLKAIKYPTLKMKSLNAVNLCMGIHPDFPCDSVPVLNLIKENGGNVKRIDKVLRYLLIEVPLGKEQRFMKNVIKSQMIKYVNVDYPSFTISYTPNDSYFYNQWGHKKISCPAAWDITKGDWSVIVAVIDTGVDYWHPDLNHNMWRDWYGYCGYDFADEDYDPLDDAMNNRNGHGTHVAGLIPSSYLTFLGINVHFHGRKTILISFLMI